jgi:hypothetical protein
VLKYISKKIKGIVMLFRKKKKKDEIVLSDSTINIINIQSSLGRHQTSIKTAKKELYHEPIKYNPLDYIDIEKGEFFGLCRTGEDELNPIYIPKDSINHRLYAGITRSGKGIIAGIKCVEYLQYEGQGLIYLDVKQEDFTPQIIKEELQRQDREEDLIVVTWPNDFSYSGISNSDSIIQIWEKICVAINIQRSENDAVEHYRSNQRMTLLKLLTHCLGKYFKADWYEIMEFVMKPLVMQQR